MPVVLLVTSELTAVKALPRVPLPERFTTLPVILAAGA
jgi:hypothetical protein